MRKLVIIAGATASGKTAKSIKMAKELGGEIICGDSMQIYKHMPIVTANPTQEEQDGVPHHLFGVISPLDNFSVSEYVKLFHFTANDISSRNKLPILVGGTGLYLDSIAHNRQYTKCSVNNKIRTNLDTLSNDELSMMLKEIDAAASETISNNDRKRLIRALEVYQLTGKTKTEIDSISNGALDYDVTYYAIDMPRDILYERINKRVNSMIDAGLVSEIQALASMGVTQGMTASQCIGYKEILSYLEGKVALDDAVAQIQQATRRYAKRQLTWFRKNPDIIWLKP
ncbi:MAG: tRNA (adenosine(37)-N6)-dimethylallyltransferase MiaA [Clostridiales bacterium]|jgi:tRNA dimethylallyltransferase|nr:tRNA (adenosine(37)-N6)-dimethylallyltransferase MiaA [Clostridiales bacterium]